MRAKVTFCTFLFIIFALVGCRLHPNESGEDKMSKMLLMLSLEKSVYQIGEDIHVSISLKNVGSEDVVVNNRMALNFSEAPKALRDITLIISRTTGETIPFTARVNVRPINQNDFIVLSPSQAITSLYNIIEMYGLEDSGSFLIFAIYQNMLDADNNTEVWKGEIKSNSETFEIVP